ncbi:hypothetical protein [Bacteroides sp.]|uniref:hypothetical protein n=1 Tax=Bacteroides sp. TaxID=29523 RepID=UPI00260E2ED9|nr:hypothetical protein [Bacteroides sp.]MDD3039004.1 hypothetical protein [Bacteroides sp.]
MKPPVANAFTAHISPVPMAWKFFSSKYVIPVLSAFTTIQMNRYMETANLFALLRHLIGGNGLSIVISLDANDYYQLDKQIRFQVGLLILYAEVLSIPAIACLYRHEIERDVDLKMFFNNVIGDRYIKTKTYYDENYARKENELPHVPLTDNDPQSLPYIILEGIFKEGTNFVTNIVDTIDQLFKDLMGIVTITLISGAITSIFSNDFIPIQSNNSSSLQSSMANRREGSHKVSPEVLLGYANWKQILNTSLYASLIGETLFKMYADLKLSPLAWKTLNPFSDVYWTYLKLNIIFAMRLRDWVKPTPGHGNFLFQSGGYLNPIFTTGEYPTPISVTKYMNDPSVSPHYTKKDKEPVYPSIAFNDISTHFEYKKDTIPTSDTNHLYDGKKDSSLAERGIFIPAASVDNPQNPNVDVDIREKSLATSVFTLPCCKFVTSGESGCIQAMCATPNNQPPAEILEFLGLDPELAKKRAESSRDTTTHPLLRNKEDRIRSGLYVFNDIIAQDSHVAAGETSITDIWGRIAEVYITQDTLEEALEGTPPSNVDIAVFSLATDHSIEFKISSSNEQSADTAVVTLYNINPSTKTKILAEKSRILVKAGYEQDFSTIFEGFVTDIYDTRIGADTATTIIAFNDMLKLQRAPAEIMPIAVNEPYDQVIAKLLGQVGIPVGVICPEILFKFGFATILYGNPYMNLQKMAHMSSASSGIKAKDWYTDPESYTFYIQDNIGYFVKRKYISPTVVTVGTGKGKHGGLLTASKTDDPTGMAQAEIKCILNHRIKPDVQIDLHSITLGNKNLKCYEVSHICSKQQFVSIAKLGEF